MNNSTSSLFLQDYARRIRESAPGDGGYGIAGGSIGIATISSITVGIISVLVFGLLVFLAVAKRRRRNVEDFATSGSRTTISGTPPVMTKVREIDQTIYGSLINTVCPIRLVNKYQFSSLTHCEFC